MKSATPAICRWVCVTILLSSGVLGASAREIHVAKSGDDAGSGSQDRPYLTIAKASEDRATRGSDHSPRRNLS